MKKSNIVQTPLFNGPVLNEDEFHPGSTIWWVVSHFQPLLRMHQLETAQLSPGDRRIHPNSDYVLTMPDIESGTFLGYSYSLHCDNSLALKIHVESADGRTRTLTRDDMFSAFRGDLVLATKHKQLAAVKHVIKDFEHAAKLNKLPENRLDKLNAVIELAALRRLEKHLTAATTNKPLATYTLRDFNLKPGSVTTVELPAPIVANAGVDLRVGGLITFTLGGDDLVLSDWSEASVYVAIDQITDALLKIRRGDDESGKDWVVEGPGIIFSGPVKVNPEINLNSDLRLYPVPDPTNLGHHNGYRVATTWKHKTLRPSKAFLPTLGHLTLTWGDMAAQVVRFRTAMTGRIPVITGFHGESYDVRCVEPQRLFTAFVKLLLHIRDVERAGGEYFIESRAKVMLDYALRMLPTIPKYLEWIKQSPQLRKALIK